jgi:hypothetical protein
MRVRKKLEKLRTKALIKTSVKHEGDFSSTSFIEGFDFGTESIVEVLKDKRNKYNAWLAQEQNFKLSKTANFERTTSYKAYIQIIDELLKDLKL